MSHKHLALLKVRAPRGSKQGWPTWTGQVPPELHERLIDLCVRECGGHKGEVVMEALTLYAELKAHAA